MGTALDDGLWALGMGTGPVAKDKPRPQSSGAPTLHRPYLGDGVDGADEVVVIERVSPEEEERRYFANLAGGDDLFAGISSADAPDPTNISGAQRQKPKVAYE